MKNLIDAIWNAPSQKLAGAITGSITVVIASDVDFPKLAVVALLSFSAFLSFFTTNKPK